MAPVKLALTLIMLIPAPALAAPSGPAPAGTPNTRYCMSVEAATGSRIEKIYCWTRAEWAEQGVDVDADWAKEGVKVIEPIQPV